MTSISLHFLALSRKVYLEASTIHLLSVCCTPSTPVEVQKAMQSPDLVEASNIVIWNQKLLSFLGLWPPKMNHSLFIFFTIYMIIYYIMAAGDLIKNFDQLERVVANLTDNVIFAMILGKMLICRRSSGIMTTFLKSIEIDFTTEMYDNVQQKMAYLYYNKIALIFVKMSISLTVITASFYYFKSFAENWNELVSGNFSYKLPYPVHPFFEIKDMSTYICICIYLTLCVAIIVCGYAGPDAYILSMALHVCGQLAVLSCKVNHLLKDGENYRHHISNIVLRHYHLIRLAEILKNNFNIICLLQTLGTVFLLCFALYHIMATSEYSRNSNNVTLIAFALYVSCVANTILGYCYIGECLITESIALREAFYNSNWYDNPPSTSKLINICIVRAERPLTLTAGKFYVLSLNMFTSIVKTSVAYLSVLRHFI